MDLGNSRIALAALFAASALALPQTARGGEIPLPAPEAYRKAVLAFRSMGAIPTYADEGGRTIRTDYSLTRLTEKEADCGSRFGIPYIKDRKVKTAVAYEVRFEDIDGKSCEMHLKIHIDGYVDIYEGEPSAEGKGGGGGKKLMCRSTGVLEKRFEEALKR